MVPGLGLAVAALSVGYFAFVLIIRTGVGRQPGQAGPQHHYVLVVPCLNEQLVLRATLESLLALPAARSHVLVVDDASDDDTGPIAASYPPERVTVLRRTLPDARRGKGAALNHAVEHIRTHPTLSSGRVVVGVVDADGRVEPNLLDVIDRELADPQIGAVQVGVRIRNRNHLLGRFQDLEFASFSSIVQVARTRLGSVGLGGNGQFTRLEALGDLGRQPWTDCLTEDLDLGLQLALAGWRLGFTDHAWVAQQGLTDLARLVRQRTRWVQGHFQTWRRIPAVVMSDLPNRTVLDLLYYLFTPMWMLLASLLFTVPVVMLLIAVVQDPLIVVPSSWSGVLWFLVWYVFSFGMSLVLAEHYRRTTRDIGVLRTVVLAHALVLYNFVWYLAGWRAVGRLVRGRSGWVKTGRVREPLHAAADPA